MPRKEDASLQRQATAAEADALIAHAPARLAAMSTIEEVFELVRESVPVLFPGCLVLLYRSSLDGKEVELTDVLGLERSMLMAALKRLGFEPRGERFAVDERFREIYARTTLCRFDGGLADFSSSVLPAALAHGIERLLGIREIHSLGLAHGDRSFGAVNVLLREREIVLRKPSIESFAHQCFLAMSGIHSMSRLRDSEQRYRNLLRSLPVAVQVVRDGEILYCNPSAVRLFGLDDQDQLQGMRVREFVSEEDRPAFAAWLRGAEAGTTSAMELRMLRRDGRSVIVEVSSEPLVHGDESAVLLSIRDLTKQKEAERALLRVERDIQHAQKLEGLGVLAGGVAHEFNNALAVVLGNVSLAMSELPRDAAVREVLEDAITATQRAIGVTRQMMAYAGQRPNISPLNISEITGNIESLLWMAIPRTAKLDMRLVQGLPLVEADAAQVQQALLTVVTNAAEALGDRKEGTVSLKVAVRDMDGEQLKASRVRPVAVPGRYVAVEIADDGAGMSPEVAEHMFEPFFSTKFLGRGLGLAAVHGIVRAHAGAILVDTAPSRGTRVTILLPALGTHGSMATMPSATDSGDK